MQRLTVHQKTVTCLKLATTVDQQGRSSVRLLSGGLDGMVKVGGQLLPLLGLLGGFVYLEFYVRCFIYRVLYR